MRNKKGQSILEYVIVLTVIIAAIATAANTVIKNAVNKNVQDVGGSLEAASGRLPK
jgi:hypothetical protein